MTDQRNTFQKWIFLCAAGEVLGITIAALIAFLAFRLTDNMSSAFAVVLLLAGVALAGASEGVVLGYFQSRILKDVFKGLRADDWVRNTAMASAICWVLGTLISIVLNVFYSEHTSNLEQSSEAFQISVLAIGMLFGTILGFSQWLLLKQYSNNAASWILANTIGWALGFFIIFYMASIQHESSSWVLILASCALAGIGSGHLVGFITGLSLEKMKAFI